MIKQIKQAIADYKLGKKVRELGLGINEVHDLQAIKPFALSQLESQEREFVNSDYIVSTPHGEYVLGWREVESILVKEAWK